MSKTRVFSGLSIFFGGSLLVVYQACGQKFQVLPQSKENPATSTPLDITLPRLTLDSMPSDSTDAPLSEFTFTAVDEESGIEKIECRIDAGSVSVCSSPLSISGLSVGDHSIEIVATDKAGNRSESLSHQWKVTLQGGCLGDGLTDDTDCLNGLINDPKIMNLTLAPNRRFLIRSQIYITSGKTFNGSGSTLVLKVPQIMIGIAGSNVAIQNVKLSYEAPEQFAGIIEIFSGSNIRIENCELKGMAIAGAARVNSVAGIRIAHPAITNVRILNNRLSTMVYGVLTDTYHFKPEELPDLTKHNSGILIDGNTITQIYADGIEINSAIFDYQPYNSGIIGVATHDLIIRNNKIDSALANTSSGGFCIGLAGAFNAEIYDNILTDCKWQGVHIEDESHNVVIRNNKVTNVIGPKPGDLSTWTEALSGVLVLNSFKISIINNVIENPADSGVWLACNPRGIASEIIISGNTVKDAGGYSFDVCGDGTTDMKSVIGPLGAYGPNISVNPKLGGIRKNLNPVGLTVSGNTGF